MFQLEEKKDYAVITFIDDATDKPKRALVQVKSGHIKASDLRDLRGTVEREKAALGIFITLRLPSEAMKKEAAAAGFYHSPGWNQDYARIQILTISDLLAGERVRMPPTGVTFKQAQKVGQKPEAEQGKRLSSYRERQ
jgi:site-specific DNA-methyltransferase (adenine-specific)